MTEFWTAVVGAFRKIGPIPLTAIAFTGALLLFAPEAWLTFLDLNEIVTDYRSWIGLSTLFAWAMLASSFVWWIRAWAVERLQRSRTHAVRVQYLHELTSAETAFLVPYIFGDVNSRVVPLEDGIVGGLVGKGILFRAAPAAPFDWETNAFVLRALARPREKSPNSR